MATNYVQEGEVLTLAAPRTVAAGEGALVGNIFGVALAPTDSGDAGEFARFGVWTLAAASAATFSVGDVVYWDDSAHNVTDTATGNDRIGVALATKAGGATTAKVLLDGVVL